MTYNNIYFLSFEIYIELVKQSRDITRKITTEIYTRNNHFCYYSGGSFGMILAHYG